MVENEKVAMDLKDMKIIYELDKNCRQSCSEIGKKVGLSSEVVNYRIKKLEEEKVITHYQVVVNLSKLGIIEFKIVLSLENIDSEKMKSIITKVNKTRGIMWVASCKGNWDMIISGEAKSMTEINPIKDKVLSLFSGHVNRKEIAICYKAEVFNRNFLLKEKAEHNRERILVNNDKECSIDELDKKILAELAKNGRESIVEIAHRLKESERVVNYRIKQLEKYKVIEGFRIAIDYSKIGVKFYKTFVYLEDPDEERVKELILYFKNNKNIIHNVQVIGNWDFEPEFEVFSEEEFDVLLQDMKDKFSDIIKKVDILTISKEHKFAYL